MISGSPRLLEERSASAGVSPVTSGTCTTAGPFETVSVIVVPCGALATRPRASRAMTWPTGGWTRWLVLVTVKPAPFSALAAFANGCPTTFGTAIGLQALRDVDPHLGALDDRLRRAAGACAVTVFTGGLEYS